VSSSAKCRVDILAGLDWGAETKGQWAWRGRDLVPTRRAQIYKNGKLEMEGGHFKRFFPKPSHVRAKKTFTFDHVRRGLVVFGRKRFLKLTVEKRP
jgi:hypothetical protein